MGTFFFFFCMGTFNCCSQKVVRGRWGLRDSGVKPIYLIVLRHDLPFSLCVDIGTVGAK